jgi:hypothetical protein
MQTFHKLVGRARNSFSFSDGWRELRTTRRRLRSHLEDRGWKVPRIGNDRTAYVIGLFGSGRWYINELMLQNIGKRARYFRDTIRLQPGPTSMIYSGHATMKYPSRDQALPEVTRGIVEAVRSGIADSIFIYRHPLDSLLTNWVWWRTYIRENKWISGISQVYANRDDLCADLEANFLDFKAFAEGDPDFLARVPGPRVLSFPGICRGKPSFIYNPPRSLYDWRTSWWIRFGSFAGSLKSCRSIWT